MPVKQQDLANSSYSKEARIVDLERKIRAAYAQRMIYSSVLAKKLGLHQTELECLFIITLGEDVTPGRLSSETGLTTGAITGVVDRIEAAGYITRKRDPDDRRRVFLIPVQDRIEEIRAINKRANGPWLEELNKYSDVELNVLLDFADRNYHAAVNATLALREDTESARTDRKRESS